MQYFSRHLPGPCPGFHRDLISVVASVRPGVNTLPETSARACFGAQICRGTCPGIARISPRPDFGCRFGEAGIKYIARNFIACLPRYMDLSRHPFRRCPVSHRGLISVVAPARFDSAGRKFIARNFIAALLTFSRNYLQICVFVNTPS